MYDATVLIVIVQLKRHPAAEEGRTAQPGDPAEKERKLVCHRSEEQGSPL